MKKILFISVGFLACLFFPVISVGAEVESVDHFTIGKDYFDAGKFDQAYESFMQAFENNPENLDTSFYMGRAAYEQGDYEVAIMAFDRVLIMEPTASRVKLELARCHIALKAYVTAKHYLNDVLATDPPENVRRNIEKHLEIIANQEKRHVLDGYLALGLNWDDNVRVSPADERFSSLLGEFTLTGDNATPDDDLIYNMTVAVNHAYKVNDNGLVWKNSGVNYNGFYNDEHDLDINFLSLTSGLAYGLDNVVAQAEGVFSHLDQGYDRYLQALGVKFSLLVLLKPRLQLDMNTRVEARNYFTDSDRDSTNVTLSLGSTYRFGPNRIIASVLMEQDDAARSFNSYDRSGLALRYERMLSFDISAFLYWNYQQTSYKSASPNIQTYFGEELVREDEQHKFGAGLSFNVWQAADKKHLVTGRVSHTYTDTDSNLPFYKYSKNVTAMMLMYRF